MIRRTVPRRILLAVLSAIVLGAAFAAAPCGVLLGSYLEPRGGKVLPCLVDLQEAGLCFRLPGMTLESATRTLDGHLQANGATRPEWISTSGANGTFLVGPDGERLEIVIAADGPFSTTGTCRIMSVR